MSNYYDVVIATPGETFDQHYVWSIINTTKFLNDSGISYIWLNDYSSHVGEVRQRLAEQASSLSYNKLFWIDSDIYWDVKDFIKLYNSNLDIVSGCYLTTAGVVAAQDLEGYSIPPEDILSEDKIIQVRSTGFGFLCMKKNIIESLSNPFSPIDDIPNEDVAFCVRAKNELNISTWLDTSIKLEHFRTMSLNWNRL